MSDLISRRAAIRNYCGDRCGCEPEECGLTIEYDGCECCAVVAFLQGQPTIEAEPVKHGRWIEKENLVLCSKCGRPTEDRHDAIKEFNGHRVIARVYPYYCGFCGAKMDEVEDDLS